MGLPRGFVRRCFTTDSPVMTGGAKGRYVPSYSAWSWLTIGLGLAAPPGLLIPCRPMRGSYEFIVRFQGWSKASPPHKVEWLAIDLAGYRLAAVPGDLILFAGDRVGTGRWIEDFLGHDRSRCLLVLEHVGVNKRYIRPHLLGCARARKEEIVDVR